MIEIARHINLVVEAPYLDAGTPVGGVYPSKYKAYLWCREKTGESAITSRIPNTVDTETKVVRFAFSGIQIDKFASGDVLTIVIYENEHNEAFYHHKAFKVIELNIPHEEEEEDSDSE